MKIRIGTLRRLIREALIREYGQAAGASGSDPTDVKGFYPYDTERGTDVYGFWYRSPGREVGADGDPYRAADAAAYIGQKPPVDSAVDTPGEDAAEDMESPPLMPGESAPEEGGGEEPPEED